MNIDRLGRIELCNVRYVDAVASLRVIAGDVLFNNTNSPGLVGKTAYFNRPGEFAFSNHMTRLRVPQGVDAKFLALALHLRWLQGVFRALCRNHVNQASVSARALLGSVEVDLPPLAEQRRIVATIEEHLSRLDAASASMTAALSRLKQLRRLARAEAVATGKPVELRDLLDRIEAGRSFRCHSRPAEDREWGVVKVSAMTWGAFDPHENKAVLPGSTVDTRWEIKPGDVLLSRANTTEYVGAAVLVGSCRRGLLLSDKSLRLVPAPDVDRRWLVHALTAPDTRAQIARQATGTSDSMRNISQAKVRSLHVRLPGDIEEQQRVVARIDRRITVIDSLETALRVARRDGTALRRSILERAFRGELVPQDPSDEPADALLERIRAERAAAAPPRRRSSRRPAPTGRTG